MNYTWYGVGYFDYALAEEKTGRIVGRLTYSWREWIISTWERKELGRYISRLLAEKALLSYCSSTTETSHNGKFIA